MFVYNGITTYLYQVVNSHLFCAIGYEPGRSIPLPFQYLFAVGRFPDSYATQRELYYILQ